MNKAQQLLEELKSNDNTEGGQKTGGSIQTDRNTDSNHINNNSPTPAGAGKAGTQPTRPAQKQKPREQDKELPQFEVNYITDPEEAGRVINIDLAGDQMIGLDIETMKLPKFKEHKNAGLSPYLSQIRLVQLCQKPEIVHVFDIHKTGLAPIKPVFAKQLVAHNAVFEMLHLYHSGASIPQTHCTMLMHNALYGGLISLKELTTKLIGIDISKTEQKSDWSTPELTREQLDYAALDAWLVQRLYPLLLEKLTTQNKWEVYQLLQQVQSPTMKMIYDGCHFDAGAHYLLSQRIKEDLERAQANLKDGVGTDINLNSGKQLSDHFKKVLDAKIIRKWKTTNKGDDLSLDKETIQKFSHIQEVAPLAEYNALAVIASNYGDSLREEINPVTGRIHPGYKIAGARTGRFSCAKPNLQKIPKSKEYRDLFNAPSGRKIVVADYSQVELRVMAILSGDETMLQSYCNGEDLHRVTASSMAGIPLEEVTEEQRSAAKGVIFGIQYGMSKRTLKSNLLNKYGKRISEKRAGEYIEKFYAQYPEVKRWVGQSYRDALLYKSVETKIGRNIPVTKPYTESRNYPIQGSAGEVMLAALIEVEKEITSSGLDIKIVNTVHDEIILEVAEEHAEPAKELLEKAMINGMLRIFPEAETNGLVDAAIGNTWGEAK